MKPIQYLRGYALWYSPDDNGYYWQSELGWGDKTSQVFKTVRQAVRAMKQNKITWDN